MPTGVTKDHIWEVREYFQRELVVVLSGNCPPITYMVSLVHAMAWRPRAVACWLTERHGPFRSTADPAGGHARSTIDATMRMWEIIDDDVVCCFSFAYFSFNFEKT